MVVTMKKLLLIDPNFPHPKKSVNHQDILPVGLLKIGAYYKSKGWEVVLQRLCENQEKLDYEPNKIMVTSLYTYWSKYVRDAVVFAKENYDAPVEVGGVFASLQPQLCKEVTGCDSVHIGIVDGAEDMIPDYSLLNEEPSFQVLHTTRGCTRRCKVCGVYCIEPHFTYRDSIKDLVFKRKLVFYDNNLLANPNIENILRELIILKKNRTILHCESQSGFDGRILRKKPYLAKMLKQSGFVYPKIAWDGSVKSWKNREKEVEILADEYKRSHISVFMLLNHEQPFEELERKRLYCWKWGVQIGNCRYRPLDALYDNYNGRRKNQTNDDYFIHPNWTDREIKQFNSNVRKHNLCIRFRLNYHSPTIEKKKLPFDLHKELKFASYEQASDVLEDCWNPNEYHGVE